MLYVHVYFEYCELTDRPTCSMSVTCVNTAKKLNQMRCNLSQEYSTTCRSSVFEIADDAFYLALYGTKVEIYLFEPLKVVRV